MSDPVVQFLGKAHPVCVILYRVLAERSGVPKIGNRCLTPFPPKRWTASLVADRNEIPRHRFLLTDVGRWLHPTRCEIRCDCAVTGHDFLPARSHGPVC